MSTVQTLRSNKATRYDARSGQMVEIEQPPAIAAAAVLDEVLGLLRDLLNDATAKKRVTEFADAVAKARDAGLAAVKSRANHAATLAAIEAETEAHTKKLADEKLAHDQAMERRLRDVEMREKAATDTHASALRTLAEATALKADLQKKLDAIRRAAE